MIVPPLFRQVPATFKDDINVFMVIEDKKTRDKGVGVTLYVL